MIPLYLIGDFSPVILDSEAFCLQDETLFDKKCFHQHLKIKEDKLISRRAKTAVPPSFNELVILLFLCNCMIE